MQKRGIKVRMANTADTVEALVSYLKSLLGQRFKTKKLPKSKLSGLPVYLARAYVPYEIVLFGRRLIALVKVSDVTESPRRVAREIAHFHRHLKRDVFVVLERIESWNRQRLIKLGIPFAVPGYQLYLPMLLLDLRERFPRRSFTDKGQLSWAGQVLLLRHLLFDDVSERSLSSLAERLDYSAMTMSKVASELSACELATTSKAGRSKVVRFPLSNIELWQRALPRLRSPVFKRLYVRGDNSSLCRAGVEALSLRSSLQPDDIPTCAVRKALFPKLTNLIEVYDEFEAELFVELWHYNPKCLTNSTIVDELSLYLALSNDPDERVQIALEQMMESLQWSKA